MYFKDIIQNSARFDILTAVLVKILVFWDVALSLGEQLPDFLTLKNKTLRSSTTSGTTVSITHRVTSKKTEILKMQSS
jgi:predicted membrane protein